MSLDHSSSLSPLHLQTHLFSQMCAFIMAYPHHSLEWERLSHFQMHIPQLQLQLPSTKIAHGPRSHTAHCLCSVGFSRRCAHFKGLRVHPLSKAEVQSPSKRRPDGQKGIAMSQSGSQLKNTHTHISLLKIHITYDYNFIFLPLLATIPWEWKKKKKKKHQRHSYTKVHTEACLSVRLKLTKDRKQGVKTSLNPELTLLCLGTKRSGKNS